LWERYSKCIEVEHFGCPNCTLQLYAFRQKKPLGQ
jgi:hypothetical protein